MSATAHAAESAIVDSPARSDFGNPLSPAIEKRASLTLGRVGGGLARAVEVNCDSRFVYVIVSATNPQRHYVGLTSDVPTRLAVHNSGGSQHTAQHRPWRLIVSLEFATRASAIAFEKYLKTGSGRAFAKRHFV